jgi:exopolyphosphatase/pppGpp-phosphohydrolase
MALPPTTRPRHTCLSELGAHGGPTALLAVMAQARHKDPKTSQKYVHTGVHLAKLARQAAESQRSNRSVLPTSRTSGLNTMEPHERDRA